MAIGTITGLLIGAAISAGTSVAGAKMQSNAAGRARDIQAGSDADTLAFLREQHAWEKGTDTRDFTEDTRRYDKDFGEGQFQDRRDFGEGTRRWDANFGEDKFRDRRDFTEGTRRWDLEWNENTRRYERREGQLEPYRAAGRKGLATMGQLMDPSGLKAPVVTAARPWGAPRGVEPPGGFRRPTTMGAVMSG